MEFGWFDDGDDGEHTGVDFVLISYTSAIHGKNSVETASFDRVYLFRY